MARRGSSSATTGATELEGHLSTGRFSPGDTPSAEDATASTIRLRVLPIPGDRFAFVLDGEGTNELFDNWGALTGHEGIKDSETGCVGMLVFNRAVDLG